MKENETGASGSRSTAVQGWLSRPEGEKSTADTAWQNQEFGRIMETTWPTGFPAPEAEVADSAVIENLAGVIGLPETFVCRTTDDYERQERLIWQRCETLVNHFWSNYLRISGNAYERYCSIERAVWRIYDESVEPARLRFEESRRPARVWRDKAAMLALRQEYAEATGSDKLWRLETLQDAAAEYEQIVSNARSGYDRIEALAGEAYKQALKKLKQALEQSPQESDHLEEAA